MSFYRRFISYMYDISDTAKRKNCGFVKIEIRGSKCTFWLQLKNAPCRGNCSIYLCQREGDPEYIFIKKLPITDGNVCYRYDDQNLKFDSCCGILCVDENGKQCGTCWDQIGVLPEYMVSQKEDPLPSVADNPQVKENSEDNVSQPYACEITQNISDTPPTPKTFPELWEHLQKEFSSMDPFEDDAIVEPIKITPSDLGYLQSLDLNLGSNQFLLHGYKNYHHLLLGRLHGQNQYILGIPGIYDPQEQFMAKMFGFPCFKPIRECRQKNGQFGYWMKCFR